jgi:hypothetical protein
MHILWLKYGNGMGMVCEFKKKRTGTFGNITNSNLDATISLRIKT